MLADSDASRAYLGIETVPGRGEATSFVVHRVEAVATAQGRAASRYAGQAVGQIGDVGEVGATYAVWPSRGFRRPAATRVPTLPEMGNMIAGMDPADNLLGPYAADDAGTEEVLTRHLVLVPPPYVPIVIHGGLTARELWAQLGGAIVADGNEAMCAPLLTHLRVLLTDGGNGSSSVESMALAPTLGDEQLEARRAVILRRDLPSRGGGGQVDVSRALTAAVNSFDRRTTALVHQAAQPTRPTTKLPADRWPTTITVAYRRAGTVDDSGLPPSYFTMAQVKKGEERVALQGLVEVRAGEDGAATVQAPIITPEIARIHMSLRRHATDKRDLTGTINAFMFALLSDVQRRELEVLCALSDTITSGGATPSVADTLRIARDCPVEFPQDPHQMIYCLRGHSVYVDVDLSPTHPAAQAYRDFITLTDVMMYTLLTATAEDPLFPARFVLATVYRWHTWYRRCALSRPLAPGAAPPVPPPPDFGAILHELEMDSWKPPTIPARYLNVRGASGAPREGALGGGGGGGGDNSGSGGGGGGGGGGGPPGRPTARVVRNEPNPHPELLCLRDDGSPLAIATLLSNANGPPPRRADNTQMCIAFHCLGTCNSDCTRSADHVHDQPDEIIAKRAEWCSQARG